MPVTTRSEAAIAAITSRLTRSNDPAAVLADGHRWNEVRELLASVGVRGSRVYPVRVHGVPFGALVAHAADPWGQQRASTDQTLADLVSLVLSQAPAEQRQATAVKQIVDLLRAQVAINQAYGMLAEAGGTSIEVAASVLASYANSHRLTQAEVAGWLVADAVRITTVLADRTTTSIDRPVFGGPGV